MNSLSKAMTLIAVQGILSMSASGSCRDEFKVPPRLISLKGNIHADKIYFRRENYFVFLDAKQVFNYLTRNTGKTEKKLLKLIKNDYVIDSSIDIYKYPIENRSDVLFFYQSPHIIDSLVFEMLKNGFANPRRMYTYDEDPIFIEEYDVEDSFSSFSAICAPNGELLLEKLNWIS